MIKSLELRGFIVFCCILFIGCSGNISTPKGIHQSFDFRNRLPADIAQISDQEAIQREKEIPLGITGEKVILKWRTYKKDNKSYNLSGMVEVPRELKGIELIPAAVDFGNTVETNGESDLISSISLGWSDIGFPRMHSAVEYYSFSSDGELEKVN